MSKSQIEEDRVRFEKWAEGWIDYSDLSRMHGSNLHRQDEYLDVLTQSAWDGWLAAKQDAAIQDAPTRQPRIGDVQIGCAPTKEFLDIDPQN